MSRNYNMKDSKMCQQSRVIRQHFIDNKADFIAFDLDFNDPFEPDWLLAIEAAEAVETDETRDSVLQQETEDVLIEMRNGRKKIVEVEVFAKKAFPNDKKVLEELGFGTVSTNANTQDEMITFLTNLHRLANGKYNAAFLAVNFQQHRIDEILDIRNALAGENTEQDTFARKSAEDTSERIATLNTAFEFWQKVNSTSKALYYDNPIKLNYFLFPRGTESQTVIKIQGTVRNSVTNALLSGVAVNIPSLNVTVNTDNDGQYIIGGIEPNTYDMQFTKAGYQVYNLPGVVVPADGNVVVDVMMIPV